jgi:hypothetical protein
VTPPQETNPPKIKPHESKQINAFSVAPSPFNAIKLELGIVIVVGVLLLIGVNSITHDTLIQIGLLFIAGASAMVWIIWRTRKILKRQSHRPTESDSNDGKE